MNIIKKTKKNLECSDILLIKYIKKLETIEDDFKYIETLGSIAGEATITYDKSIIIGRYIESCNELVNAIREGSEEIQIIIEEFKGKIDNEYIKKIEQENLEFFKALSEILKLIQYRIKEFNKIIEVKRVNI